MKKQLNELLNLFTVPVYAVIMLTGAAGLIYQAAWQKYLSRLFGSDHAATAVVLGVFLGGLSIGYYVFGKWTVRIRNYFKGYALAEGLIGAWGIWFPYLFEQTEALTVSWSFSPAPLLIVQGLLCSFILIGVPVVCMGATIPLLTRGLSRDVESATRVHASVYAANTFGAFAGVLLAGFYLIPRFGLPETIRIASFLNIFAALFFYALAYIRRPSPVDPDATAEKAEVAAPTAASPAPFKTHYLYFIAFLSGFYVMTLENALIRIVNLSLGSSSYSFCLIVSVFIVSIAAGSFIIARKKTITGRTLYFNQFFLALCLLALYPTLDVWPYAAHLIRIAQQSNIAGFIAYEVHGFIALLAILALPAGLAGATVPILFHLIKRNLSDVGRRSGVLLSLNTIGNLSGSLIGGFILYSVFNHDRIFLTAALLAAVSVCLSAVRSPRRFIVAGLALFVGAAALLIVSPWYEESRFAVGPFRKREQQPYSFDGPERFCKEVQGDFSVLSYEDGPSSTVAVLKSSTVVQSLGSPMGILLNGKPDSDTIFDIDTLRLSAHIPALLAESRRKVMVIGLGTGVTGGEFSLYPDIERIDIAEISSSVIDALPYFREFTNDLHLNPKAVFHEGDAYRILGRSDETWDIIVSEPSNPWVTGVESLFTDEFYQRVKSRLSPSGIFLQWTQIYESDMAMIGMIASTLNRNFEEIRTFLTKDQDLFFLASMRPMTLDAVSRAQETLAGNGEVKRSLNDIGITSIDHILIREIWPPKYVREQLSHFPIQTADHPKLHYIAGINHFFGRRVTGSSLIGPATAPYAPNYLMAKKYPDWNAFPFTGGEFDALLESLVDQIEGRRMPMIRPLRFKRALFDKAETLDKRGSAAAFFKKDIHKLVMGTSAEDTDWSRFGVRNPTYLTRFNYLIAQLKMNTNWIIPDPIEGLAQLLEYGVENDQSPEDRNFCNLYSCLLELARGNRDAARSLFEVAERDETGNIILTSGDTGLAELVQELIVKDMGGTR